MNTTELIELGIGEGDALRLAKDLMAKWALAGASPATFRGEIEAVVLNPLAFESDAARGALARALIAGAKYRRAQPAPWRQWGAGLDAEAIGQMRRASQLPVAVAGALMPDAHVGYGLPIGGVLATEAAVIPYAVGVDIACRMKMTVLDLPVRDLQRRRDKLVRAIEDETRFGIGARFQDRREHEVMDDDWSVSPITRQNKDRAASQLGTSGSGNHFVEFGVVTNTECIDALPPGEYVALLSHSGSRGTGAAVCDHYSKLAMQLRSDLPKELRQLSWLDLDSPEGQEYWAAMELMGRYASANHALIHSHVANHLGVEVRFDVENHHNFAWKERHCLGGVERDVVVHRKGATPASAGVMGIIPGSMASPGFLVRGRGNAESLNSASHGAGRVMSRTKAAATFDWKTISRELKQAGVDLLSAGLDEVPGVYKDIHQVMAAQTDLVEVLGRFDPRIVKMAPHGERPED